MQLCSTKTVLCSIQLIDQSQCRVQSPHRLLKAYIILPDISGGEVYPGFPLPASSDLPSSAQERKIVGRPDEALLLAPPQHCCVLVPPAMLLSSNFRARPMLFS